MKKIMLLAALLIPLLANAQGYNGKNYSLSSNGRKYLPQSFTYVTAFNGNSSSSSSFATGFTPTHAGDLLIAINVNDQGNGGVYITGGSGGGSGSGTGAWTAVAATQATNGAGSISQAYLRVSTTTAVTITFTNANSVNHLVIYEYTPVFLPTYDSGATSAASGSNTTTNTQAGIVTTPTGPVELIVQGICPGVSTTTGVSSPWTRYQHVVGAYDAYAVNENTTSGAAPVWSYGSPLGAYNASSLGFY